jgi:hypothetical protein
VVATDCAYDDEHGTFYPCWGVDRGRHGKIDQSSQSMSVVVRGVWDHSIVFFFFSYSLCDTGRDHDVLLCACECKMFRFHPVWTGMSASVDIMARLDVYIWCDTPIKDALSLNGSVDHIYCTVLGCSTYNVQLRRSPWLLVQVARRILLKLRYYNSFPSHSNLPHSSHTARPLRRTINSRRSWMSLESR